MESIVSHDLALLTSPDMERACLSCLLNNPDLMTDALTELSETDFFFAHHRTLYGVMTKLAYIYFEKGNKAIFDTFSVIDQMKLSGVQDEYLNSANGPEYLASLKSSMMLADLDNFPYYMSIVKSFSTRRKLYLHSCHIQQSLLTQKNESIEDLLLRSENGILDLHIEGSLLSPKTIQLGTGLAEKIQQLWNQPKDLVGISTGYPNIDRYMLGLRKGSLTIVAAKYKTGKSALLENIGLNVAKQGIPVFMISTEMEDWEIQCRALTNLSKIDSFKIETGKCNDEEKIKVKESISILQELPFHHIHILDFSPEKIVSLMRRFVYRHVGFDEKGITKPCLLIFDYIKMPEISAKHGWVEHEHQELGVFGTVLKNAASSLGVPILSAAQLNEAGGVAASARLNWMSTAVILWTSYEQELSETQKQNIDPKKWLGVFRAKIKFNRHGSQNLRGVGFRFYGNTMTIEEDATLDFSIGE